MFIVGAEVTILVMVMGFYIQRSKPFGIVGTNPMPRNTVNVTSSGSLSSFYEPKPNSVEKINEWVPYQATYTINADSLNERFDYLVDKPKGTYRIITLGDSFTYGLYVDTKDNWPEQLEDMLNLKCKNIYPDLIGIDKYEVINLGVQGYDIQYSVERYRLRGQKYNPDLILWFIKLNNFFQVNELFYPKAKQYDQEMRKSGEFQKAVTNNNFYPAWSKALSEMYKQYGENRLLQIQEDFLEEFTAVNKTKVPLIIATFQDTEGKYKKILREFSRHHDKISIFDQITNTYKINGLHFEKDWHPNPQGHQAIAQDYFNYLTKNNIISCNN